MSDRFGPLVRARASAAGLNLADDLVDSLTAYLALLARWDRKINLTAFDLDSPSDAAIDRLIIEPLQAAGLVQATDRSLIDIGSGGGSPAIPMRLARPHLEAVLVEVRERKAAFLRDVIRELALANVRVACETFERFASRPAELNQVDLVTMRAVRAEGAIWQASRAVLKAGGRFIWFHTIGYTTNFEGLFEVLPHSSAAGLSVLVAT
jgi:16S rRNA (guanine527-N7)-methyltransferase